MRKDLNIAAVLGAQLGKVSGPDTGREQIEYIDIGLLEQDPDNFYQLSKVEELAGNISVVGLQQPIRVRPMDGGRYMIVSGHRRRAALQQLVEAGEERFRQVPCIVEQPEASAAMQKLRLIYANSDTRTMTSAELSQQVKEVEDLLYQLKDEGVVFKGKMRDHVAAICNVKATKLANLKVIRGRLAPCWQPWYKNGKLNETVALTLARMPEKYQQMIFETRKGENPTDYLWESAVDKLGRRMAEADKASCAAAYGGCSNRERRHKRICTQSEYSNFHCGKCCAECSELGTCKYACKLLEGKIKNIKASNRIVRQNEQRAKEERERPAVNQIKALWNRFGEARNAADKTVEQCYKAAKMYYSSSDEQKTEVMECLEGKYTPDTTLPYGYSCQLHHVQYFTRMADLFGCSVDYLLCRTDIPQMATAAPELPEGQLVFAGWMPGGTTPKEPCDVVAKFDLGNGKLHAMLCCWNGKAFVQRATGEKTAMEPVKWMMLPPDEEESV